jgi:ketosteroid isomerase-like protein
MSTARQLLTEFLACLEDLEASIDRCVDLFADDGVFEFPYMPTLGMPRRFEGKEQVRSVLELIASDFPRFKVSKVDIHELADGSGLFVEYHVETTTGAGQLYTQDYASRLVVDGDKIKLLREYLNVISTARALLPNGLADVPPSAEGEV